MPRFWQAAAWLRSLLLHDPDGSGRWLDLATVEVPSIDPVDRVTIGAPPWARGEGIGKWTLTAEGSAAATKRALRQDRRPLAPGSAAPAISRRTAHPSRGYSRRAGGSRPLLWASTSAAKLPPRAGRAAATR